MIALVLEAYGALCFFSLIAFLVLACVAKLRPDLDGPEFDLDQLEKLRKLASGEQPDFDPQVGDLTYEDRPAPGPHRRVQTQTSSPVSKPSAFVPNPLASANIEPRTTAELLAGRRMTSLKVSAGCRRARSRLTTARGSHTRYSRSGAISASSAERAGSVEAIAA